MTTEAELDAALEAHLKHKGVLARRMYGEDESKPVKWDDKTKAAERECLAVALEAARVVREAETKRGVAETVECEPCGGMGAVHDGKRVFDCPDCGGFGWNYAPEPQP